VIPCSVRVLPNDTTSHVRRQYFSLHLWLAEIRHRTAV